MQINDPNGTYVKVTSGNRLGTSSVGTLIEHNVNHIAEQFYSLPVTVTPTAALDCFAYITNNSDEDLIITGFNVDVPTDERVIVKFHDIGTASGGATVTAVNRNAGSGNLADITAEYGVDITGFSGGAIVGGFFVQGGESTSQIDIISDLIVPKNKTVTFYVQNGAIEIRLGVAFYFHVSGDE